MSTTGTVIPTLAESTALKLSEGYCESRWYAAYTRANHEKRVSEQLGASRAEHFLPLYTSMRRWKDRSIWLDMPLFPGYVFVRMALQDRSQLLQVPGGL
jgi:transcription antitermination factor NusG